MVSALILARENRIMINCCRMDLPNYSALDSLACLKKAALNRHSIDLEGSE